MENGIARGADIAVIGAAGKTGEAVVAALPQSVTARRLVRKARVDGDFEVELETGRGLRKALAGCRGCTSLPRTSIPTSRRCFAMR